MERQEVFLCPFLQLKLPLTDHSNQKLIASAACNAAVDCMAISANLVSISF
jgi:hypothetical protein